MKFIISFFLVFFLIVTNQNAQSKTIASDAPELSTTNVKNNEASTVNYTRMETFQFFNPEEKYRIFIDKDTSIQHIFTRFDPTKRIGNEHITLGNTFSAAYPLLYNKKVNTRFQIGYNQYAPYAFKPNNQVFYISKKPHSEVFFSQFSNQLNFSAGAKMAIPFKNGWSFSLNYLRVSEQGFYQSHVIKSSNLFVGLKYQTEKDRYTFILGYLNHAHDEENNGGIALVEELITRPLRGSITTLLNGAKTRHQERSFSLVQYLTLAGNDDWKLYIKNNLSFTPSYYKYSHATTSKDTLYYGSLLSDTRGVRRYTDLNHTSAGFFIYGENTKNLIGSLGLQLDVFNLDNQGFGVKRRDLSLLFQGDVPFFKVLSLQTKGTLGLANNVGNFNAEASLNLNVGTWATLTGGAQIFLSEPTYAQQTLVVNEAIIIDQPFDKSFGTAFSGKLHIPYTNSTISAVQSIETNPIYWRMKNDPIGNIDIESVQSTDVLSYSSLRFLQNFRIANIQFNHGVFLQIFNENLYNLPTWYSVHQLYWNPKIFKKSLQLSIGGELRLLPEHEGIRYSTLHGQFFADDRQSLPLFPDLDLILNAKVKTFRVSFMIENAGKWLSKSYNFDVIDYPKMDPLLRFSLKWMFYN
ncbi:MAG: putative porin [Saprospiraceae bacterium]